MTLLAVLTLAALLLIWLMAGRPLNDFQPGHFAPVAVQPLGGVPTILQIKGHSLELTVLLEDVTNTGCGGIRGRIAGPFDAAGTVDCDFDLDQLPWAAPLVIQPGIRGICVFGMTPTVAIQIPTIIEKVHYQGGVENEVKYSFDVKCSYQSGLLVYGAL